MKTDAQVVVIGGGVIGASVLYHLTKAGWSDVVLVERTELTAGSTWHSAGGMHTLNGDPNVARLQRYTMELYAEIERASGQDCGIHMPGGIMLADTPERLDWLRMTHARGRYLGMQTEMVSISEVAEMVPLIDTKYFVGAMLDAHEGHVDPAGVTHAFAKAARHAGAEVYRNCWARAIERRAGGGWRVVVYDTASGEDLGTIDCEHVVNCGGLWAREVGRMVGLELPVLAMEHTYLVTEPLDEVIEYNRSTGRRLRHMIDFGGELYTRQEGQGMLLGTYEQACLPWAPSETPWDFSMKLLAPDLDRISPSLEVAFAHFPVLATAGIQRVVNGPFTFAPDGNPLIGPVRGLPGYWTACGVMAGLSQCGGVGLSVANWITEGDPGADVWAMDVARFGDYATLAYTSVKVRENYARRFRITFPNEFLAEGRGVQTSPIHDRLVEANAVWGDVFGLESALWFQQEGLEPVEEVTFGRSNAWDRVRAETLAVRAGVGMMETTGFVKFLVSGPGARAWLNRLLAGRIPVPGRMALTPMTNPAGNLVGDLTVACLPAAPGRAEGPAGTVVGGATGNVRDGERFVVFGSGIAERYYERWFDAHLPADGSVSYLTLGAELCGLAIAGPTSRALLEEVTDADVSAHGMRFMAFVEMDAGLAPVWCGRISFTGDLGYELWMPARYQRYVFDLVRQAGEAHGLELFGLHALNSLRLEKGFGSWAREYRPDYDPFEAGLGRFVRMEKDFIGRDALAAKHGETGPPGGSPATGLRLCTWTVDVGTGPDAIDVIGDEPVWHDGEVVGWVTSGGYAHHSEVSVALGYVPAELADSTGRFEIEIVGTCREAKLVDGCLWDPDGHRMRA
ncbi:MAG: FAD-dependent oxidoreductase [Acidimicrobiaceae bacterium]|nr:FAD-dependent oxidoreductase [Acidimicrobiaceae bacterium]MXY09303.1 FAD-dependent oxidoreductase [Acidimicrobiaceae bacterium]MXZ66949.1 FAD-dependent oxidoreductase [Acidimicrobiaceae bacterium]MYF33596.1 FAD-dependent oxidoreductase [Acidimicrobiaceae bacterium]MYG77567.1 FAD-dependent oxidoreductase [Acidimicrobiaceae bacterium]